MSRARDIANFGDGIEVESLPAGSVLQVVSDASTAETRSFTNDTWVDTAFSISITPSNASNKIILNFSAGGLLNNNRYVGIRILRNGSTEVARQWSFHNRNETWNGVINFSIHGIDSPSTTSSVTYKVQVYSSQNSNAFYFNYTGQNNGISHLTAMEIAG
jgi:hypothetical protein